MPITDKTRKILWARSGNRCAFCRLKLVVDETKCEKESVVGEECHICAQSENGPRYDPNLGKEETDELHNLILLCSNHHKMIDDQNETYTTSIIRDLKANHEIWVEEKLKSKEQIQPVRIRRCKQNIPQKLNLITSGKELIAIASRCAAAYHDYSENLNSTEVDLVGGFFQNIRDYMDIWNEIEPISQVRASMEISEGIRELLENGFLVFAATEVQKLEGGVSGPSNWNVLHLTIARATDPGIHLPENIDEILKNNARSSVLNEEVPWPKHSDNQQPK
jgi:HNH endonuclease